jgi:hypothetical protein
MKRVLLLSFIFCVAPIAVLRCQSREVTPLRFSSILAPEIYGPRFIKGDRTVNFQLKSVILQNYSSTSHRGESYYMGTMTTQSYNQGKLGTFYFWDVQGNLRESKFFLDIAGKNKRGLKLVFPRR